MGWLAYITKLVRTDLFEHKPSGARGDCGCLVAVPLLHMTLLPGLYPTVIAVINKATEKQVEDMRVLSCWKPATRGTVRSSTICDAMGLVCGVVDVVGVVGCVVIDKRESFGRLVGAKLA